MSCRDTLTPDIVGFVCFSFYVCLLCVWKLNQFGGITTATFSQNASAGSNVFTNSAIISGVEEIASLPANTALGNEMFTVCMDALLSLKCMFGH